MASSSKKKSKSKSDETLPAEAEVVDAVVIEETDPADDAAMEAVDEMADADGVARDDAADVPVENGDRSGADEAVEDAPDETLEPIEDEIVPIVPPAAVPEERSRPFFPLVLGGVLAAALGFGLSQYLGVNGNSEALEAKIAAQVETTDGLTTQVGEVTTQVGEVTTQAGATAQDLAAQSEKITELEAKLAAITEELNKPRPVASEAELSADLKALIDNQKAEIAALQENLKTMATFAEGQIETAQQEADAAARAEARATARDALNEVRLALASGDAFEDAIPKIAGAVDVPAGLSDVASGVPTQAELQDSFGPAARVALASSNRALAGDSPADRVGLLFQDLIGARSLTPQEGDSPDAVLSRAEAAVKNGDLTGALETIDALPESGKAELTDWSEKATARNDALQAFSDLTDALSAD